MVTEAQRNKLAQRLLKPRSRDRGDADPRLLAALALPALADRLEAVAAALADSRLIVPLFPHAAPASLAEAAREERNHEEEAGTTVVSLDSRRRAMAVFSSVDALARAYPDARPAPIATVRACLVALAGPARLMIDGTLALPRPAVAALAQRDSWLPAWRDDALAELVSAELADLGVGRVRFEPGPVARDRVLVPLPACEAAGARAVMAEVSRRLPRLPRLLVATDTIELVPLPAST